MLEASWFILRKFEVTRISIKSISSWAVYCKLVMTVRLWFCAINFRPYVTPCYHTWRWFCGLYLWSYIAFVKADRFLRYLQVGQRSTKTHSRLKITHLAILCFLACGRGLEPDWPQRPPMRPPGHLRTPRDADSRGQPPRRDNNSVFHVCSFWKIMW